MNQLVFNWHTVQGAYQDPWLISKIIWSSVLYQNRPKNILCFKQSLNINVRLLLFKYLFLRYVFLCLFVIRKYTFIRSGILDQFSFTVGGAIVINGGKMKLIILMTSEIIDSNNTT